MKTVSKIPGTDWFLLSLESHGSDDALCNDVWSHYEDKKFNFSDNITVIAFSYGLNGAAVIVEKKDKNIPEVFNLGIEGDDIEIKF